MKTNIVGPVVLRSVQLATLKEMYKALRRTFGPNGSVTNIYKPNMFPKFTKDGLSVVREINFSGEIENSIKADIDSQCQQQAKVVGDATTSIVMLSYLLFNELNKMYPADREYDRQGIMTKFGEVIDMLCEDIKKNAKDATPELIRDICYISTNGREDLVNLIMDQYDKYGLDVLIETVASSDSRTQIIDFDGMMIFEGFKSGVYVNGPGNACIIKNPEIYFFDDPIDNAEQLHTFEIIFNENIAKPIAAMTECDRLIAAGKTPSEKLLADRKYTPTVVICPHFTPDYSAYLAQVEEMMAACPYDQKPPFLLIPNVTSVDKPSMDDLCTMSGGKHICKYLDPENKKYMEKTGKAVTQANFRSFAGHAAAVEATFTSCKAYSPACMYNEDGTPTDIYANKLRELEAKYAEMSKDGAPLTDTFNYKKRINGLKGRMVQISYGGISAQDRDMELDALDDAVLNARSASQYGVGFGANFEAFRAVTERTSDDEETQKILAIIKTAYLELTKALYITAVSGDDAKAEELANESLEKGCPFNLRTKDFDGKVLSSIETDICILKTISKILMLIFTSNQFILSDVNYTSYGPEPEDL